MGTRSDIIVQRRDGKWARIYRHWDGYLEHNGKILLERYSDQEKAEALVALDDISSLGEKIGERHDFDWRTRLLHHTDSPECRRLSKMCNVYGRDRGESDVDAEVFDSLAEAWPPKDTWTEFAYVFSDGRWRVGDPDGGPETLVDIGDALAGRKTIKPAIKAFGMMVGRHQ